MPDTFHFEVTIEGDRAAEFVQQVYEDATEQTDGRMVDAHESWFVITDIDHNEDDWALLSGYSAWDTIEVWTKDQRNKHENLTFAGLIQTWDSF